jgi:hypothetical protein
VPCPKKLFLYTFGWGDSQTIAENEIALARTKGGFSNARQFAMIDEIILLKTKPLATSNVARSCQRAE